MLPDELNDPAALRLKARRRLFSFEAGDSTAPDNWRFCPAAPPDIWYNMILAFARGAPGSPWLTCFSTQFATFTSSGPRCAP
jgi:hypothetical protein